MSFFRHRHQRPGGVSLLAFQDIITALAGAMLIIVLVIIYGNYQKAPVSAETATGDYSGDLQQLQQQTVITRSMLAESSQHLEQQRALHQTARQQQKALRQAQQLRRQTELMQQTVDRRSMELKKLQQEVDRLTGQLKAANAHQQHFLQLQQQLQDLQQQLSDTRNRWQIAAGNKSKVFLLDCRQGRWVWSSRPGEQRLLGTEDDFPAAAQKELRMLLQALSEKNNQLIIVVRPSAGAFVQALKNSLHREFPDLKIVIEPMTYEESGGLQL